MNYKTLNRLTLIWVTILIGFLPTGTDAGIIAAVHGGYYAPQGWADTHELIFDDSGNYALGFELGYTFNNPLELAVCADFVSGDGERVWPDGNGGWESDGTSVSYDLMPISVIARYRFLREHTFSPYIGAGVGFVQFDESGEDTKDGEGFILQGGGDFYITKLIKAYIEIEWNSFPDIIGHAGASRYFNEDDLGGIFGRLGIRFTF